MVFRAVHVVLRSSDANLDIALESTFQLEPISLAWKPHVMNRTQMHNSFLFVLLSADLVRMFFGYSMFFLGTGGGPGSVKNEK